MKYAIVESGGKQYKAVEGGMLEVDRLPVEPGKQVKLEQVLLLADEGTITVGTPLIKDNPIWTKVVEHFKGRKVINFNYSPKKRIRVKTGHRQHYTRLFVEQIGGKELVKKEPAPKAVEVEKDEELASKAKAAPAKTAASPDKKKTTTSKKAATTTKKTETKSATKAAPAKSKTTTKTAAKTPARKPAAKPAAGKTTKSTTKTTKSSVKKPATTGKKPAAK